MAGVLATGSDGKDDDQGQGGRRSGRVATRPTRRCSTGTPSTTSASRMINVGGPGSTGDGITMLLEAGAVTNRNIGTLLLFPFLRDKAIVSETFITGFQPYLWVDTYGPSVHRRDRGAQLRPRRRHGRRGCRVRCTGRSSARSRSASWWRWATRSAPGIYVNNYAKLPGSGEIEADAADEADQRVRRRHHRGAGQGKSGVEPAVLKAEVDQQRLLPRRCGPEVPQGGWHLILVEEGRFYAIKMETRIMISMGAMRVDDHWRALDANDHPIRACTSWGAMPEALGESYSLPIPDRPTASPLGWLAEDDIAEQIKECSSDARAGRGRGAPGGPSGTNQR